METLMRGLGREARWMELVLLCTICNLLSKEISNLTIFLIMEFFEIPKWERASIPNSKKKGGKLSNRRKSRRRLSMALSKSTVSPQRKKFGNA